MIEGTLPEALRDLTKLQGLTMDRNPMYGTVPEWLPDMRSVYWLGLSSLTGKRQCTEEIYAGNCRLLASLSQAVSVCAQQMRVAITSCTLVLHCTCNPRLSGGYTSHALNTICNQVSQYLGVDLPDTHVRCAARQGRQ